MSSKKIKCLSMLICLLGLPLSWSSNAEWVVLSDFRLWSNTYDSDTIRIQVTGGAGYINPGEQCTDADSYMVMSTLDGNSKERIYSSLLAAALSKNNITVWVEGCEQNRPAIKNTIVE